MSFVLGSFVFSIPYSTTAMMNNAFRKLNHDNAKSLSESRYLLQSAFLRRENIIIAIMINDVILVNTICSFCLLLIIYIKKNNMLTMPKAIRSFRYDSYFASRTATIPFSLSLPRRVSRIAG